jgi:tetratricopeptide (TPR) repeat protein
MRTHLKWVCAVAALTVASGAGTAEITQFPQTKSETRLSAAEASRLHGSRGIQLMHHGLLGDARRELLRALAINPRNAVAHSNLGLVSAMLGDDKSAVEHYGAALKLHPNSLNVLLFRGLANINLRALDAAISDFGTAIGLDPRSAEAYAARALAHLENNAPPLAIADATEAISLGLTEADVFRTRARAHIARGDALAADRDLREADRLEVSGRSPQYKKQYRDAKNVTVEH